MTIDAFEGSSRVVVLIQFVIEHFLVAARLSTRRKDRNVGFEASQRSRFCDVDMTGGAFVNMLLSTVVPELHRVPRGRFDRDIGRSKQLVATRAVLLGWLLTLPMTIEAHVVTSRRRFERVGRRHISISPAACWRHWGARMRVTDRAVVVLPGSVIHHMR